MLRIKFICVGKMKEKAYKELTAEYLKRLSGFCRAEITEINEERLPAHPSEAEMAAAKEKEAEAITRAIPKGAITVALCVEGEKITSPDFSKKICRWSGVSDKLCFIVGGSTGLADGIKKSANYRLSFSDMTFPHHLFRIMLLEQAYRAMTIDAGTPYHK